MNRPNHLPPSVRHHPLAAAVALAFTASAVEAAALIADGTKCTLIDAITAANTDTATGGCPAGHGADIINFTADVTLTAVNNETYGFNGLPSVTSVITVNGHGHTISRSSAEGTPEFRLLHIADTGNLTLKQVTLRNGLAAGDCGGTRAGALFNFGIVALVDSTLSGNNTSLYGGFACGGSGGLWNEGTATLTNSTVSGNSANYGGGIVNVGTATLTNSTISGNSAAAYSGGLLNSGGPCDHPGCRPDGTVTIINSTVSGNSANYGGGGLTNGGILTLTNSTVSGNSANYDGGGFANAGTATLTNSTVSGNSARYQGGGLVNTSSCVNPYTCRGSDVTLTNSTVSGNSAATGGGLVSFGGCSDYSCYESNVTLTNSLIANSAGGDCSKNDGGVITPTGLNLIEDGSCNASSFPPGTDPQLRPLAHNGGTTPTHALLQTSPALNAIPWGVGGCGTTVKSDQRGVARPQPQGGHCDIGAVEAGGYTNINPRVSFKPTSAGRFTAATAGCSGFPAVGKFSFEAQLTNNARQTLNNLFISIKQLSGPPGAALATDQGLLVTGDWFAVPATGGYTDGKLSAGESVTVPFAVCLKKKEKFTLFVDVLQVDVAPPQAKAESTPGLNR